MISSMGMPLLWARARPDASHTTMAALNARLSRALRISNGVKLEGLVEAFNLTNRTNSVTRNANFGSGAYPSNPMSTFNQTTAVGDPRTLQFGVRVTF